ncbi:FOG: TPR repeat [Hahella chejuensis KCTC 2396]|uniref:FOG: TPR repeat n=1 Tax=Hahella chejuensis (strain KCTC 2396) TaxID=349521 RepID=Q2SH37_HAHCH|nr:SycD/LcrH family type III secretion system chaperone [Hahella chejuensis]ABC30037.1 FOG: TPR repeat [Hahella chejuensis KCTC 2396]
MTQQTNPFTSTDAAALLQQVMQGGGALAIARGITQEEIEAIYTISYNLYQQRKFEQAEKTFAFLCLYSHLDVRFWTGLGACRESLGKYAEAIEAYSYSALLQHDNPVPPLQAAKCYLALNDLKQARNGLTAALHWSQGRPQHQATYHKAQELLGAIDNKTQPQSGFHAKPISNPPSSPLYNQGDAL